MKPKKCLYRILGIRPNSSAETVKKAYRKKAMKFHPDRNPGCEKSAAEYQAVQDAYDVLSDPQRRAQYDATGSTEMPRGSVESELMNSIFPHLMASVQEIDNNPFSRPETSDLINMTMTRLQSQIRGVEQQVQAITRGQTTLKKVIGRISVDDGENLLDAALRAQLDALNAPLEQAQTELDRLTRAKNYLKKCKYKMDGGDASPEFKQMMGKVIYTSSVT